MAMMGWMRRTSRYFLAFVVITFIASLAYFGATQERARPTAVATVNGEDIPAADYERAYRATVEQYRQALRDRMSEELLRSLRLPDQVVERLVTERLIAQQAAAEGIRVSDEEVAAEITRIPAFQEAGRFSHDRYTRVLARLDPPRTPSMFEAEQRAALLNRKLQALVTDGVKVSDAEVRLTWETRNDRVRAGYLLVPIEPFLAAAEPSDAEVQAYYDKHSAEFTRPERRRVQVAVLPASTVTPPAVTDADVETAYNERRSQYEQPERRRVAHVLVRVPTVGGSEAEDRAKARAEAALTRIKGGADFAQVAREVSEDTGSASRGGEVGTVARGEMVKPFEELAFSLKAGEVGGPVRTAFGYHVVKVTEIVPPSKKELKEVAPALRVTLAAEAQQKALRDKADEVHQALLRAADFAAEARKLGLTTREVGPLARPDVIEGVGRVPEASNAIFGLGPGGISGPVRAPEGYAVFRLLETEPSRVPPLADVRADVVQKVRREKATEAARTRAGQVLEAWKKGEDPRALAKRDSLTYEEVGPFSRAQPVTPPELGPVVGTVALALPEGGTGGPTNGPKGLYVVKVLKRERADAAEFEKARADLSRQLLEQKKGQAWQAYLAALRVDKKIEINRQVLPKT
jgi:peptidyl-prolyl cis-trans isomerase D